jgi:hypothetical protein
MVDLLSLWLSILLSAVIVFVASSIIHMVLPIHRSEYKKLPGEDALLAAMRDHGVAPGEYVFPCAPSFKEANTPEMQEKYGLGPRGFVTVAPSGTPALVKPLVQWFLYSLVIGVFVAYAARIALPAGTEYLLVFRLTACVAFLAYGAAYIANSIWKSVPCISTLKHLFDALVYGLLTGGVFGWLWPN